MLAEFLFTEAVKNLHLKTVRSRVSLVINPEIEA